MKFIEKNKNYLLVIAIVFVLFAVANIPTGEFSMAQRPDPTIDPDMTQPPYCLTGYTSEVPIEWQCTPTPVPTANGTPQSPIMVESVPMICYPNGECRIVKFLYLPVIHK